MKILPSKYVYRLLFRSSFSLYGLDPLPEEIGPEMPLNLNKAKNEFQKTQNHFGKTDIKL
jgi:hypothetical protein